jgi:hypothetical protein
MKCLRDHNGLPIGKANNNLILDTRMYEVEYPDGHKIPHLPRVDDEGNRQHVLFEEIGLTDRKSSNRMLSF